MVDNILKCPGLTTGDCRIVTENMTAYEKLFKRRRLDDPPPAPATALTTWQFSAVQLTYNGTCAEWCSKDKAVLQGLFDRFLEFAKSLGTSLAAK